jgi:hypothetical protein
MRNVTTILVGYGGLWLVTRFTGNSLDPLYILGTVCVHHFDKSKLFSFAQILVGGYIVFYTTQSGLALASHFITSTGKENCHSLQRLCLTSPWPAIIADSLWCPVFSVITGIIFWILGTTLFVHVLLKALHKTGYDRFPEVNLPLVKGTFVEALYNCVTFLSWVITGGVLIAAFLFSGQVKGFLIMFAVIIGIFMILVWFSERSRRSRGK